MREIVLDTETTGLDPKTGDRIVEIGCVELINHLPTENTYHQYINPERDMPDGAFRVHGLSEAFLSDYPTFSEIADEFMEFVGTSTLIIHNADFDMGFINWELQNIKRSAVPMEQALDTVRLARRKFPGAPASLDALCRRFNIDNSDRELHGALKDALLLAEVYLELIGGRQTGLGFQDATEKASPGLTDGSISSTPSIKERPFRPHPVDDRELEAHARFIEALDNAIWLK